MHSQIFISYRRNGGDVTAKLICDKLTNDGYSVFFDYDAIKGGAFDERIVDAIKHCTDVVLVLPEDALDRCEHEDDWLRKEIRLALRMKKNIVPVMLKDFEFPEQLPDDIRDVTRYNGVRFSIDFFDAVIAKICEKLSCRPGNNYAMQTTNEDMIDEGKFIQSALFGFGLGRIEFLWNSKFDFAQAEFKKSLSELTSWLDADAVRYKTDSYECFTNSIISFYVTTDIKKLYAILIGHSINRLCLASSTTIKPSQSKELLKLARASLSTVPSSFLRNKDAFIKRVEKMFRNGMEVVDVIKEVYLYVKLGERETEEPKNCNERTIMPRGNVTGQGMDYCYDIVMCIDVTGSMSSMLNQVKENALSFYQKFVDEMEGQDPPKSVQQLRIKVIAFRDYGVDSEPMIESKFFVLDEEREEFFDFVNGIEASGGGDEPENALEALALAIKSDWVRSGGVRRHVIMMYTDASALPLGVRADQSGYPADMPRNMAELRELWEQYMEKRAKRLLIFAPDVSPWSDMADWTYAFHTADDTDIDTCIHLLCNSI